MARIYHPDRVPEAEKPIANESFKMIYRAYAILSNPESKKVYDFDKKCLYDLQNSTVLECGWTKFIKTVDSNDFEIKKREYQNSTAEKSDILRELANGNGSMTHLFNTIPFMRYEDEDRIVDIINTAMKTGEMKKISIKKIRK